MSDSVLEPSRSQRVTERIVERSRASRARYLDLIARGARGSRPHAPVVRQPRARLCRVGRGQARRSRGTRGPNIGIVTAYNDMLSAHQPYGRYPEQMKIFAREVGATAQVAGGVAGDVRRRHAGPARHGAVAVQPRRHRAVDRGRAEPRDVRQRARCSASATRSCRAC